MPCVSGVNAAAGVSTSGERGNMQLESLELAGATLDRHIVADNSRPSFLEVTGVSAQKIPTCSGLGAGDYKNLAALLNHPNLSQLKVINKVPLPAEIMEHFAHMQCHCLMGVFPEISRAWLAVDSNIYVWAFENGSDVAYFDGLGETIVSVGLIKPKPGVYQSFIKYLLILTTTVEIVVLGVAFSSSRADGAPGGAEEMHLVPEPVLVLPTDGVSMMVVQPTATGRIFLGGKDGCLYEITYQAQQGWFGKHCKKVNHSTGTLSFLVPSFLNVALYDEDPIVKMEVDDSRHILYTLSEKGSIEAYDLGRSGDGLSRVAKLTQAKIVSQAVDIVKTLEASTFRPVIAISAVEEYESEHLNLVAVTATGVRLYFTTGYSEGGTPAERRPFCLSLLHVRLPPGFTPNACVMKPKQVHSAVYENGSLLMVCSAGAEQEVLWCLSRVLPGGAPLSEAHTLLPLDGPAWALARLPPQPAASRLSPALLTKKEVWWSGRWAVVTGGGAAVLGAGAAPDLLCTLLRECRGADAQPVKDFFQLHSMEQACACAAYLACEGADSAVAEWATRAFFLYGGQPAQPPPQPQPHQPHHLATPHAGLPSPGSIGSPKFSPRQMSTPMTIRGLNANQAPYTPSGPNQSHMGSPNQSLLGGGPSILSPTPFNQSSFGVSMQQPQDMLANYQMQYSTKHNGLYIYVGRILAPIWQIKCVTKSLTPDKKEFMSSTITGEDCAYLVGRLQRAAGFLQRTLPPAGARSPQPSHERGSLHALLVFVNLSIEMLSLWKILCEHQFHVVAASLPPEQQTALQAASFREVLVGGQEVACLLLGSLVAGYLRDNASVDGISQKLRQLCPTLYRAEDATCSKANELLLFAKQQKNSAEREEMLRHALKLCKDVAPQVNLPLVCSKFVSAGFYSGVVELCVACANKMDPQNKALHYYKSEQPTQDHDGELAYFRRMEMYREVCVALERLYERSAGGGTGGGGGAEPDTTRPSPASTPDTTLTLSPADANYQGRKLVWECLSREEELLHVAVYEWLVSRGLGGELLALGAAPPASLRAYLAAAARAAPAPAAAAHLLNLLWKVLEKSGDHLEAAKVLEGLATAPGSGATLERRAAWLSAGVVCVRGGGGGGGAGGGGAGGGELLRRLEEAAEVARVQAGVRAAVAALPRALQPPPHHMRRLHTELLEITQLYEEFADRYKLWECKLAIVHCSGHNDAVLVENIWSNILTEEEALARSLSSPDDVMRALLSKVTTLGRQYVHTGHCFPLYFIVRQLEIISCKLNCDHCLVFKAILNIGVSLDQLLDIYIKLVSVGERVWLGSGDELHAARAAAALLEAARAELAPSTPAAAAGTAAPAARRRALVRCKDLYEACLSALQARPNTQPLIQQLAATQAKLDRIE